MNTADTSGTSTDDNGDDVARGKRQADTKPTDTDPVSATLPPRRRHPRRGPLIATTAAAAVALAAAAIATGGFGIMHRATPPPANPAAPVRVPVDAAHQTYIRGGGPSGGAPASGAVATMEAPSSTNGLAAVDLYFVGGAPPTGALRTRSVGGDGTESRYSPDQVSDGTPLGYVIRLTGITGDAPGVTAWTSTAIWGAVGPEVSQVRISSNLLPISDTGNLVPGFSGSAEAQWTIRSGTGAAPATSGPETSSWTPLVDGWNGFAVELPRDASWATVVAFGAAGQVLQDRRFDLDRGTMADLPVPPVKGATHTPTAAATDRSSAAHSQAGASSVVSPGD